MNKREGKWKGNKYFKNFYEEERETPWFKGRDDSRSSMSFSTMLNRIRAIITLMNHWAEKELLIRRDVNAVRRRRI